MNSEIFDEVMVSTDSYIYSDIAKSYGAKVPFLRSEVNSSDVAKTIDTIIEVLNEYERRKFHLECTEIMYEDFKQNGLNAKICSVRQYSEDEIKHFMSYIDKNGLDSMFCLQDYSAHKKFTLQRNEIEQKLWISCIIVDSNDLGQEILGKSDVIFLTKEELKGLIKDNPAGQGQERTPMILIREKKSF